MSKKMILSVLTSILLFSVAVSVINIVKGDEEIATKTDEIASKSVARFNLSSEDAVEELDEIEKEKEIEKEQVQVDKNEIEKEQEAPESEPEVKEPETEEIEDEVKPEKEIKSNETEKVEKKVDEPVEKKANAEIVKEVKQGKWGSGSERKVKLTDAGYNYSTIQEKVNESVAASKPAVVKNDKPTEKAAPKSKETSVSTNYKANRVYINGTSMPTQPTTMDNLQAVIDSTQYTWVTGGDYDPSRGTYFAAHSNTGGSIIYNLSNGDEIIATDSSGNPYVYVVGKIYVQNKQEIFDDETSGRLDQEYVVFQTSEPRVNGNRNGNRYVIAYKK